MWEKDELNHLPSSLPGRSHFQAYWVNVPISSFQEYHRQQRLVLETAAGNNHIFNITAIYSYQWLHFSTTFLSFMAC